MAAAPQWAEVAKGALAIAQILAIFLGAGWAYFKFVRGRTFAERLEASVGSMPFQAGEVIALRIRASITNTGASIVRLDDDVKVVYVYGAEMAAAGPGVRVDWGGHLALTSVFAEHKWVEAQETVSDEVLVTIPDSGWVACRVELIIASKKKKRWGATAIVPATDIEGGRKHMQAQNKVEQDDLTPDEKEKIRRDLEEQREEEERKRREKEKEKENQARP
jgi:hypothetical protein